MIILLLNIKEVVRENKEKVEDTYKRVMKMAHLAHREGLLALDYEAEFIPKETPLCNEIAEIAELIAGGMDPKIFEELMTIKFFAVHNYTGIDALLYFLYARSMYMIQEDMEYMGPVIMCDVEESEEKIIGAARKVLDWENVLRR